MTTQIHWSGRGKLDGSHPAKLHLALGGNGHVPRAAPIYSDDGRRRILVVSTDTGVTTIWEEDGQVTGHGDTTVSVTGLKRAVESLGLTNPTIIETSDPPEVKRLKRAFGAALSALDQP